MASQALGQGYAGNGAGGTAFSGVAQAMLDFGRRKGNFQQELAVRAMDHELTSIRETNADGRTAAENALTREHQSSENAADRSHAANLEAARLKAQQVLEGAQQVHATGMQTALLSHEGTQNALGRIYDTISRNAGFQQDAAMSDRQHQQATEMSNLNFSQMKEMAGMPRIGGSYESTPGGFKMTSDTEHRTPAEIGKEAKAPRRKAGTPVAPAPTTESVAETPAKPEVAPAAPVQAPEAPSAPVTSSGKKNGSVAEARAKQNGFGTPRL